MAKVAAKDSEQTGQKPLWRKPFAWLGGLLVTALGAVLISFFTDLFDGIVPDPPQAGDPVTVSGVETYRSDMVGGSVAFAADDTPFDEGTLADLNDSQEPTAWLEERGGSAVGSVFIQMVLTGNRTETVRILDIGVIHTCGEPLDGMLFLSPPAGGEDSIKIYFDLDSAQPRAMVTENPWDPEIPPVPYFPDRTISLADGEQQVVLVQADTRRQSCSFTLDLQVLDSGETKKQLVHAPGNSEFKVTANIPETEYEEVYLGGVICPSWVKANEAYFAEDYLRACDGP